MWSKLRSAKPPSSRSLPGSPRSPGYPPAQTQCDVSAADFARLLLRADTDPPRPALRVNLIGVSPSASPHFTFGHLSTISPLARSHYCANGEGHVGGSRTPIHSPRGKRRSSLCRRCSRLDGRVSLPLRTASLVRRIDLDRAPGGKQTLLGHTASSASLRAGGYFLSTTSVEKSRKCVGPKALDTRCKQQARTALWIQNYTHELLLLKRPLLLCPCDSQASVKEKTGHLFKVKMEGKRTHNISLPPPGLCLSDIPLSDHHPRVLTASCPA
ncbi:unnamed protein product [Pleuronectes platessa]|uniref:Uncharacterized protein n=1 Tax=Pleuronectes platessa TaxID=8262 RepID=A0A9N7VV31_PLEPL|nr:unnamed protein product [Pleuronectes platessa]